MPDVVDLEEIDDLLDLTPVRELAAVESTKYRILTQGKIYDIVYVNPMGYKRNSLKFNCKLEKR